jgi:hypothetical protein
MSREIEKPWQLSAANRLLQEPLESNLKVFIQRPHLYVPHILARTFQKFVRIIQE